MTRPTPAPAWTDGRLDAAFHARFDVAPTRELAERIHGALAETDRRSRARLLDWLQRGAAPALIAVVVLVIGIAGFNGLVAGPSAAPSDVPSSAQVSGSAPTPAITGTTGIPTSITVPGSTEAQPVLTVGDALAARSSGQVGRELVVGGWYLMTRVPCAQVPDPTSELESCAVDFTWLMAMPEDLTVENADGSGSGHAPVGPAINAVLAYANWTPPANGAPVPVVVTGHFDDRRADACPPGDRLARCKARFVVDAPLWVDERTIDVAAAPSTAGGYQVHTIAEAISVRDSGSSDEIAVAGWYNVPGAMSCPFIPATDIWWLEGYCESAYTWLMEAPEALITTSPDGMSMRGPTGPAIQTAFDPGTSRSPMGNGWPNVGSPIPIPVVFVGHFNDDRSSRCTRDSTAAGGDAAAACRSRFVVDSVAWLNGSLQEPAP